MDRGHRPTEPDAISEWKGDQSDLVERVKFQLIEHYSTDCAGIQGARIGGRAQ
jgi:hypothetical protein